MMNTTGGAEGMIFSNEHNHMEETWFGYFVVWVATCLHLWHCFHNLRIFFSRHQNITVCDVKHYVQQFCPSFPLPGLTY